MPDKNTMVNRALAARMQSPSGAERNTASNPQKGSGPGTDNSTENRYPAIQSMLTGYAMNQASADTIDRKARNDTREYMKPYADDPNYPNITLRKKR